jgi:hypothetical protein
MLGELLDELELELLLSELPPPPQAVSPRPSTRAAAQAKSLEKRPFPGRLGRCAVARAPCVVPVVEGDFRACDGVARDLRAGDSRVVTVISARE